jgi:hypothetical protein
VTYSIVARDTETGEVGVGTQSKQARYQDVVRAFQLDIDGDPLTADRELDELRPQDPETEPDQLLWRAVVAALAEREDAAKEMLTSLGAAHPQFLEAARRFGRAGLLPPDLVTRIVPASDAQRARSASSRRGARHAHASPASSTSACSSSASSRTRTAG